MEHTTSKEVKHTWRVRIAQQINDLQEQNKRLIDSNRELLEIVQKVNEWGKLKDGKFTYVNTNLEFKIELQTAINNAKNIQP